jgi:miniconductance mechanosensitive channel
MDWINFLEEHTELLISNLGVSEHWVVYFRLLVLIILLIILSSLAFLITKRVFIYYLYKVLKKSSFTWDDLFADTRAFNKLAHIAPAVIVRLMAPAIFRTLNRFFHSL